MVVAVGMSTARAISINLIALGIDERTSIIRITFSVEWLSYMDFELLIKSFLFSIFTSSFHNVNYLYSNTSIDI